MPCGEESIQVDAAVISQREDVTLLGLRIAEDAAFPVAEKGPLRLDAAIHGLHVLEVVREGPFPHRLCDAVIFFHETVFDGLTELLDPRHREWGLVSGAIP